MSLSRLYAAEDLRSLGHGDLVQGLSFSALITATAADRYDVPVWRSMSNLIGAEWMTEAGLPSPTSWWGPRRSDAKALAGNRRTMTVAGNGGDLVISSAVSTIAAAIRPRLILQRAGAAVQEVSAVGDAVAPEWVGGTGAWVGSENGTATKPALTVGTGSANPHTAITTMDLSSRIRRQAPAIEADLTAELGRMVAGTVEDGLIAGQNTANKPLGLFATPGATAVPFAAAPTYAELVQMTEGYYDNEGDPEAASWFINPSDFTPLLSVTQAAGTGAYAAQIVAGNLYILGIRAFLSNHVPAGKVALVDPRNILITYWRAPLVITNPYDLDITGELRLTVRNDVDIAVRRRAQLVIGG